MLGQSGARTSFNDSPREFFNLQRREEESLFVCCTLACCLGSGLKDPNCVVPL